MYATIRCTHTLVHKSLHKHTVKRQKETITYSFDDTAETVIDKQVENNTLHTPTGTLLRRNKICLQVCVAITALLICFQWQSWWPNYHLVSFTHTSPQSSSSCFLSSSSSPALAPLIFDTSAVRAFDHFVNSSVFYSPSCLYIITLHSHRSASLHHLLNNSAYLSLNCLVNITQSLCHLLNDSHNIHLPVQPHNHLLLFSISALLFLCPSISPLQPFFGCLLNDLH